MTLNDYVEKKKIRNKSRRDLVTGMMQIIAPQLAAEGLNDELFDFRDVVQKISDSGARQLDLAAVAIYKERKLLGRSEMPLMQIKERLIQDWYRPKERA